ncbi:Growth-regulating factor 7 [Morella rubra]|uniref:Growth-regulating factor n=1 Tax=Morella rubra TaxID=262757 RepID=A0A6A1UXU7_9ROSI|nr:Growth-regulating factor 7 [Morella rubra]
MTIDGFDVLDKEARQNSGDVPKLGARLQSIEWVTNQTIMFHHENHHRPFPSCDSEVRDGDGPTSTSRSITIDAYDVAAGCSRASVTGGGAVVRAVQPFDISSTSAPHLASKSPGRMAASLGFPFTNAQWKELERQAMIYKYMMASVPVPSELLIPVSRTPSDPAASLSPLGNSGLNLRLSSSTDPEPGRCKRTDGKKWRCSRDVAPDHKYCERHLHRGRPRSRKPVEIHANNSSSNIKRIRCEDYNALPTCSVTMASSNPTIDTNGPSSHFFGPTSGQPFHQPSMVSIPPHKEPRSLDWMVKGEPVPMATTERQWYPLMQTKMGFTPETLSQTEGSVFKQNYPEESPNLNTYAYFSTCENPQSKDCPLFLGPDMISTREPRTGATRGFIDAWSNTGTEENMVSSSTLCSVSSDGLSPSSLTLSMGGSDSVDEEMGQIQMGLGLMERDQNNGSGRRSRLSSWHTPASLVTPTPGGPLAEVLRPSTFAITPGAASHPSSPIAGNGDPNSSAATMVSSPSGVLQKTFASLSDSSGNSSPTLGSSRTTPEIAMLWLNQE